MAEAARLSRRSLFTLGFARVADEIVPASEPQPDGRPRARVVDRGDWVARQQAARAGCDAGLWAPAAHALLHVTEPHRDRLLLAAGSAVAPAAAGCGAQVAACGDDDLGALPFADAHFHCAISAFAPMFSLDARGAIAELFRVVRPGGSVAFTAWTAGGIVGRLLRLAAEHDPLPSAIAKPLTWGREERLRQDLEQHSDDAACERRTIDLRFEDRDDAVDRLLGSLHPLAAVPGRAALRTAMRECIDDLADGETGPVTLAAPYLVARATVGIGQRSVH